MGKSSSSNFAALLVDGYDLLGAKPKTFTHKIGSAQESSVGLGDTVANATVPTGLQELALSQGGAFFDDTANAMHALLSVSGAQAVARVLACIFNANTIGNEFLGASGAYVQTYEVLAAAPQLTKANAAYQVSGAIDRGRVIQNYVTRAGAFNTKTDGSPVNNTTDPSQQVIPIASATKASPCVVTTSVPHGLTNGQKVLMAGNSLAAPSINSDLVATVIDTTSFSVAVDTTLSTGAGTGGTVVRSNSLAGGAGIIAVSSCAGFTSVVVKIRSSADDSTYADLVTFTTVTPANAPRAERVTCAGTVDRYLCVDGAVVGSGTIKLLVGFARS